jgi:hypothetical protein
MTDRPSLAGLFVCDPEAPKGNSKKKENRRLRQFETLTELLMQETDEHPGTV